MLLETFMRQNQYFNELETDIDFEVNRTDFREAEEQMTETTANKAAELVGIDPNDKWTILRRLAAIDNRLNIDRAYASDTLKQIEDLIASGNYKDINEITAELMAEVKATGKVNAEWDKEMQPLTMEDLRLIGNKGFHGVDKAIAVAKRKEQAKKWDISNFVPMWEAPKHLPDTLPF